MSDNLLGGMIGVDSPKPEQTKPRYTDTREHWGSRIPARRRDSGAPPANKEQREVYVRKTQEDILTEWRNRPMADPNAEVVGRDDWGRKIELHADGWEAKNGIAPRRFVEGDIVYVMHGVMARTLLLGTVGDNLPNYIQEYNTAEDLKRWVDYINVEGEVKFKADKDVAYDRKWIPLGFRAVVHSRAEGKTLTVGLTPAYEVEVIEGPLTGLHLLETPSMIVDENGIDAQGVLHPDVARKAKELETSGAA
jgi:hypothetical protein